MSSRTYNVTVEIDSTEDRATVTVRGTTYRYPWSWDDNLATLARRAVSDNYRVSQIQSVIRARLGAYVVTAEVF